MKLSSTFQRPKGPASARDGGAPDRKERWLNFLGRFKFLLLLLPGFYTASMDLTIVATAQPFIASHFRALNQVSWIGTAFTLTETAFVPFFGQLADVFGRYTALQTSAVILVLGGIICAAAPLWPVLAFGRALQGVGSAGITTCSLIILADQVSLKEQAFNTSIFHFLIGVAYSTGPVIGGQMTNVHWHYVFVLVTCLSALAVITAFFLQPNLKKGYFSLTRPRPGSTYLDSAFKGCATIDFVGTFAFVIGVLLIILATSWGGSTYAWTTPQVLVPLILGPMLLVIFVVYQKYMAPGAFLAVRFPNVMPVVPWYFFMEKDVRLVCIISAATGAALYSAFYFAGVYFTIVEGMDAAVAGLQLMFYVPGIGVGVYSAILMCNVWPRQTIWPLLIGSAVETGAIAALSYAIHIRHRTMVNVLMGVAGFGTGIRFMPENLHLTGMYRDRIASILGLLSFAGPFGGTLALTVMGSVFQNKMSAYLSTNSGIGDFDVHAPAGLDAIADLRPEVLEAVRATAADAVMWAFISIIPFLALSIVAALLLGNVWISKQKETVIVEGESSEADKDMSHQTQSVQRDGRPDVLTGSYFRALLRGSVKAERHPGPLERRLDQDAREAGVEDPEGADAAGQAYKTVSSASNTVDEEHRGAIARSETHT